MLRIRSKVVFQFFTFSSIIFGFAFFVLNTARFRYTYRAVTKAEAALERHLELAMETNFSIIDLEPLQDLLKREKTPVRTVHKSCKQAYKPEVSSLDVINGWQLYRTQLQNISNTPSAASYVIHVKDAFFNNKRTRFVRMFTIDRMKRSIYRHANPQIFCYFWSPHTDGATVAPASRELLNSVQTSALINRYFYAPFRYTCALPDVPGVVFTHVSLSLDACARNLTNYAKITYARDENDVMRTGVYEHRFAVFVPISYGHMSDHFAVQLVEWFELHRLLGVTEFHIYNGSLTVDPKISQIFDLYARDLGVLRLHQYPPPLETVTNLQMEAAGKILTYSAANDCANRNKFRIEYLSVVDIDEVIVPSQVNSYEDMIAQIQPSPRKYLTFQSSNYFMEYPPDPSLPHRLPMLRHRRYVDVKNTRLKNFQNPRVCENVHSHFCLTAPFSRIRLSQGRVHHYRSRCESHHNPILWSKENCDSLQRKSVVDNSTGRFKDELLERVDRIWEILNQRNSSTTV